MIPDIPINNDDEVHYIFKQLFLNTVLITDYK